MELFQDRFVHIDHVPGLVIAIADVRLQGVGNGQVMHLKDALVIRRRQIVIATGQQDLQTRIGFHRKGKIRHHVGTTPLLGRGRAIGLVVT